MAKLALQVTPDGEITELDISSNALNVLQTAVDGLIEAVDLTNELTLWVNEEGLLRSDLKLNLIAQAFYSAPIMGTIVFTGGTDDEGETLGLDPKSAASIERVFQSFRDVLTELN
jgi:hypothetical protein